MIKLIHASDFHFTGSYFQKDLWKQFKEQIRKIKPDVIIVTGDITDNGYPYEYEIANKYLKSLNSEIIVIPGNHDARNLGYETFEEFYNSRWFVWEKDGVVILGGDSSEPDVDDGHIGRGNYNFIKETFKKGHFKIFAIHHHLLPIPNTGREKHIPVDAGDILKIIVESNVNMVLSGHKHVVWQWKLNNTLFLSAGTATTNRVKGKAKPSFYLINIDEKDDYKYTIEEIQLNSKI